MAIIKEKIGADGVPAAWERLIDKDGVDDSSLGYVHPDIPTRFQSGDDLVWVTAQVGDFLCYDTEEGNGFCFHMPADQAGEEN